MQQDKKSIRIQLPEKVARKGFIVAAKAGMTRKEFIEMKVTELFTGKPKPDKP